MTTTWLHSPKQERSRSTSRKIIRAASKLLRGRPLEQVSVAEIARSAGISVGGYYARFSSKESLLSALYDDCLRKATRVLDEAMKEERWIGQPIREVIRAYLDVAMRFFCKHRLIVRQVIQRARDDRKSALGKAVSEFNTFAHGRITTLLTQRCREIRHEDPASAALFGVRVVSAALRDFALFGAKRVVYGSAEAEAMLDELTRIYVAYLKSSS